MSGDDDVVEVGFSRVRPLATQRAVEDVVVGRLVVMDTKDGRQMVGRIVSARLVGGGEVRLSIDPIQAL